MQELLREVCRLLEKRMRLNSFVLFGSFARGEETPESDIDLIIVSADFPKRFSERFDIMRDALKEAKLHEAYQGLRKMGIYPQFSVVPYRPEELVETPPLLLDVVEDGIIVKDDETMATKLHSLRQRLSQLGAERRRSRSGARYWILKPTIRPGEVVEI